ncbi:MAG: YegP family protein [Arthrobacter sp.]
MAGYFELVDAPDGGYRLRLLDGSGELVAITVTFPTKRAAVAGVAKAREIAGTGLIRDLSRDQQTGTLKLPSMRQHSKVVKGASGLGSGRPTGATSQKRARTHHQPERRT